MANTSTHHIGTQAQFPLLQRLDMLRVAWEGEVLPGPLAIFLQSHVPPPPTKATDALAHSLYEM